MVTDREEVFENLTGEIAMDGGILSFTDVTATDGGKGRLRASGAFEIEGRRQILDWNQRALVAIESASGRPLWEYPFPRERPSHLCPWPRMFRRTGRLPG